MKWNLQYFISVCTNTFFRTRYLSDSWEAPIGSLSKCRLALYDIGLIAKHIICAQGRHRGRGQLPPTNWYWPPPNFWDFKISDGKWQYFWWFSRTFRNLRNTYVFCNISKPRFIYYISIILYFEINKNQIKLYPKPSFRQITPLTMNAGG